MFKRQRFTCMISQGYNIRQTYTNKRIDMLTPTEYSGLGTVKNFIFKLLIVMWSRFFKTIYNECCSRNLYFISVVIDNGFWS